MLVSFTVVDAYAQNNKNLPYEDEEITYNVQVIDSVSLISGDTKIHLWGIEKIKSSAAIFDLKVRKALEGKIAGKKITCTIKERVGENIIKAQCINYNEEDLSLFLLQHGYATADRAVIHETVYEKPYLEAESQAQSYSRGVWLGNVGSMTVSGDSSNNNFMLMALFLMGAFIAALGVLSFYIMRSFGKVVDIQSHSMDLAAKERVLKDKEKYIIASMIYAEIKSNKSKIDAYLIVYEEILKGLKDPNQVPKYQKTGDIVQKQPNLNRSVFDGNTSKIDSFGSILSSNIIHYYARIKTNPDYIDIPPDTPKEEVIEVIEAVVSNTKKLSDISDKIVDMFIQNSLIDTTK